MDKQNHKNNNNKKWMCPQVRDFYISRLSIVAKDQDRNSEFMKQKV